MKRRELESSIVRKMADCKVFLMNVIFMFSSFGGTFALGWLTSFTLLIATFTNLVFLPVIMIAMLKKKKQPEIKAV